MGFMDKVKEQAEATKRALDERNQRIAEQRRQARELEAERQKHADEQRASVYAATKASCPLPVIMERLPLAGGVPLFEDEFVVSVAKDWGWSTQKLTLTTHRVIWSKGVINTDQQSVYLTDVRDVRYHKQFLAAGAIALETSGGRSIEGLPAASNGAQVRDRLMAMVHWARQRAQQPMPAAAPVPATPDRIGQLQKLGELKAQGILTEEEFQAEKSKLLASS